MVANPMPMLPCFLPGRRISARRVRAGLAGGLTALLLTVTVALPMSVTGAAAASEPAKKVQPAAVRPVPAGQALVGGWAARLEQRAAEIEAAPKAKATRIGFGAVVKKGDGGLIEAVLPELGYPTGSPSSQPNDPLAVSLEPEAPAAIRVRSPLADRVGRVARRLIELGHLPEDQWSESFDDRMEEAVRAFQTAVGLIPDGKVGEVTRQALDRTPAQTVALIRRAAASMRAAQPGIPDTVVLVNLPAQTVTLVDRGRTLFAMRAVVGRPSRKTPLLQDRITSVTINPTWTVPPTVLTEDKLPVLRKKGNTGIKNAVVYLDGNEVAPETVNWWSVDPGRIRIVQKPGDDNALGRFRFNLTNGDGIFLHGTNDPKLFDRDLRAASSGCVRLADARLMADTLLAAAKLAPPAIAQQLDSGETRTVRLPTAIPVRFVYWTASVDTDNTVRVHPDIYEDQTSPAPSVQNAPQSTPQMTLKPKPAPIPAGPSSQMPARPVQPVAGLSAASVRVAPAPAAVPTGM